MTYHLFCGSNWYPSGGIKDHAGTYETREAALIALANSADCKDWWHIVDAQTMEIVLEGKQA